MIFGSESAHHLRSLSIWSLLAVAVVTEAMPFLIMAVVVAQVGTATQLLVKHPVAVLLQNQNCRLLLELPTL